MPAYSRRRFVSTSLGSMILPAMVTSRARGRVENAERIGSAIAELAGVPGSPEEIARDEDFWAPVQAAFTQDRAYVNLNNGGVSPSPRVVQEAMKRRLEEANSLPTSYALWQRQHPRYENVRQRLALEWGVDAEELAITRNSSESLQTCQFGMDLKPGDEVLTTTVDYPRMVNTFRQMERRHGIRLVQIRLPIPSEDDAEVVRRFEEAVTARTRVILVCHMVNITGQILPVKRVVEMARGKNGGIPVIVDGAHALAHFQFRISELECDYYAVSLHKWLAAPHGTGLLYVRRDKIAGLWPLMAADAKQDADIRKFEEIGTHPEANALGIAEALTFHQAIGGERKEARLRYLRDSWARPLLEAGKGRVRMHTSLKPEFSCGIGTVQVEGVETAKLQAWLWEEHAILTTAIRHDEFEGLRVTASVYTTMEEIGRFVAAVERVIRDGLPRA